MLDIKQIVRVIEDGQYVRVINTSGNDLLLPITLFGTAAETASFLSRINTLTDSHTIAIAGGVIRPTFTTIGQPITWDFLYPPGDGSHNKLYFTPTIGVSGNVITLNFPTATRVITGMVTIDDALVAKKVEFGTAMGLSTMEIVCKFKRGFGAVLTNNGTAWDTINLGSGGTNATISYNAVTGVITLANLPYVTPTYNYNINFGTKDPSLTIDATVRDVFNNLANGELKFQLVKSSDGSPIIGAPDANWTLRVGGEETPIALIVDTLNSDNSNIWEALSNLWVFAILQLD